MLSSMVDNVLIMMVHCDISLERLEKLAEMLMSQSKALICLWKCRFKPQRKEPFLSVTTSARWRKLQTAFAIGSNPLLSNEFIMHLYTSIDEKYEFLVINILAMMEKDNITIEELFSLMLSRETRIDISVKKKKFYMICQLILLRET